MNSVRVMLVLISPLPFSSGNKARIPQSRKEKIEAELKLLEWHKMANAAAIKVLVTVSCT